MRRRFSSPAVSPRCRSKAEQHFIGADGIYYPCCYTRVQPSRGEFFGRLGPHVEDLRIKGRTRSQILKSRGWKMLMRSFRHDPMKVCLESCPAAAKNSHWGRFDGRNRWKMFDL